MYDDSRYGDWDEASVEAGGTDPMPLRGLAAPSSMRNV